MSLTNLDTKLYNYFTNLKNNDIEFDNVKLILDEYNSDDWKDYIVNKPGDYIKTIVPSIYNQQLYVIIIITWNPNNYIKIHNHANNGCVFKILDGSLTETRYNSNLKPLESNILNSGSVSYIHNNIGYHSITTNNKQCVSLHIYSPANYNTIFLE